MDVFSMAETRGSEGSHFATPSCHPLWRKEFVLSTFIEVIQKLPNFSGITFQIESNCSKLD